MFTNEYKGNVIRIVQAPGGLLIAKQVVTGVDFWQVWNYLIKRNQEVLSTSIAPFSPHLRPIPTPEK